MGLFVALVALFKRELLVENPAFTNIFLISLFLFVLGIVLHFTDVGRSSTSAGALLAPLMSLGLYRLMRRIFIARFNHEPKDTHMDWTPGLAADRVFNIVFFIACWLIVMFSVIIMEELTKRGW